MRQTMATFAAAAIALAALTGAPRAQAIWNVELVGGLNFSQLTGSDTDARVFITNPDIGSGDFSGDIGGMKVGFSAGGLFTVDVNGNFGVQSGVLWTRRGGDGTVLVKLDTPILGVDEINADVTLTLDYVEIPILGVFSFPVGETLRMRTLVGPVLAFNTNAEFKASFQGSSASNDFGDYIKPFDLGGLIGAGLSFPTGGVELLVDARYTFGFTSVDDSGNDLDIKNSQLAILAGVGIPLTR